MVKIVINPNEPRYIFLAHDETTQDCTKLAALEKYMNKIPTYQLLPTFSGVPTPEVFLDKFRGRSGKWIYYCAAGLWREIVQFFQSNQWPIDTSFIDSNFKYTSLTMTVAEFSEYIKSWSLNIQPREYQIHAAWLILKYKLSLSELATRAGKTLIFYMVARAAKELLGANNILMIVPSVHLVKQGVKDLQDYKEYFNTEQIWANGETVEMADLTIGTFQSLVRRADPRYKAYDPQFFNKYDIICVDEAHKSPCKSIKTILSMDAIKNVKIRFGFTGTLPKEGSIEWFACQAILGPKIQEIAARELIETGYLADPIIKQFRIKYTPESLQDITIKCGEYLLSGYEKSSNGGKELLPDNQRQFTMIHKKVLPTALVESKKLLEPSEYCEYIKSMCAKSSKTLNLEQLCAMFSQNRLDLMTKIIKNLHKNIIIFAHNTEYIKFLEQYMANMFPNKHIYKIIGATRLKARQKTLDKLLESNDNILIGSYGVVSTGLTFKNIDYGMFAQSFKSDTITRQSLGRLMLRTADKSEFYLYDIIDTFPTNKIHNQALEKIKTYKHEGHKYEIVKLNEDFRPVNH